MRPHHPLYADKHRRRQIFWTWFLNAVIFVGLALVLVNADWLRIRLRLYQDTSLTRHWTLFLTATILLALASLLFHELGHVVAGWFAGLRFHQLGIGPLRLVRQGNSWRIKRTLAHFPARGFVTSVPTGHADHVQRRLLWFVLGGPLASLLLLAVSAGLFWALHDNRDLWRAAAWLVESALITAVFSLTFLITSLNPSTIPDGHLSDGARLQMLREKGAAAKRWAALVSLVGFNIQGTRPSRWPNALVQQALSPQDVSLDGLQAKVLAYAWAVDSGRERLALRLLNDVMGSHRMWRVGGRERFALEKVFLLATYERNRHDARAWLARVTHISTSHPLYLRAETAVLLLEGRRETAVARANQAIDQLRRDPTGIAQAELIWLEAILAEPA